MIEFLTALSKAVLAQGGFGGDVATTTAALRTCFEALTDEDQARVQYGVEEVGFLLGRGHRSQVDWAAQRSASGVTT